MRDEVAKMEHAALTAGWDGKWFRRAYDAYGHVVGGQECEEGQIFIEPQGMCVMAGIGVDTGEAVTALQSVQTRLDTKYGIVLLQPAYTKYHLELGEISSYPPGTRRTQAYSATTTPGSAVPRPSSATATGRLRFTKRPVLPTSRTSARSTAPSLTSTARWWQAVTPGHLWRSEKQLADRHRRLDLCGCEPVHPWHPAHAAGLKIDPCLPHEMDGFTLRRVWRGATYEITVDNTAHAEKGVASMTVNGQPVPTNTLSPAPARDHRAGQGRDGVTL